MSPFGFSGESQECLPGSIGNTCSACQVLDTKEKHLFTLLTVTELRGLCVSPHAVPLTAPQEGIQTGIGTERGNFKLNTVTVYKIEALIEKRNLG